MSEPISSHSARYGSVKPERDIALIDELRGAGSETACVEFKQNITD